MFGGNDEAVRPCPPIIGKRHGVQPTSESDQFHPLPFAVRRSTGATYGKSSGTSRRHDLGTGYEPLNRQATGGQIQTEPYVTSRYGKQLRMWSLKYRPFAKAALNAAKVSGGTSSNSYCRPLATNQTERILLSGS